MITNFWNLKKNLEQVKVFASKPNDLSLVPGTHVVEKENQLLQIVFRLPHA